MNKEFVPYEEALILRELGFDEPCFMFYRNTDKNRNLRKCDKPIGNKKLHKDDTVTPLYQQAFRWFREKHNLYSYIDVNKKFIYINRFWFKITFIKNNKLYKINSDIFNSYEEAELECLKKLIENLKR